MDLQVARKTLEELLADIDRSVAVVATGTGDGTDPVVAEQHAADAGTDLTDADREGASLEVLESQRERVVAALARVQDGSYGRCVDCGQPLPDERLEARPEAERCVADQARHESR